VDSPKAELMAAGERIQEALVTETTPEQQLRLVRARLIEHVTDTRYGARRGTERRLRVAGIAAAAVLVIAVVVARSWSSPISFVADTGESDVGDVLSAGEHQSVRVQFSEGSRMLLHRRASARVLETRAAGARVLLESGVADVSIVHDRGQITRWRFEAGPFQILVKGTRFQVSWQPATQSLSLTMQAGSVELSGSCLPAPRLVERGASLHLSCAKPALAGRELPPAIADAGDPRTEPASPRAEPNRRVAGPAAYARKTAPASFEASCETADKAELVAWANRERLAGRVARARAALLALRARFPRSTEAGTAAFALGRMAFDQSADYPDAARWFATYLAEQPHGALMGDAAGRLLEAHERRGDRAAARDAAQAYLQRFPDGPYASRARRVRDQ
jgi:transmembrane sensor